MQHGRKAVLHFMPYLFFCRKEKKMPVAAPSLSTHGWIEDLGPLVDYLFSQFILAQKSQTNAYRGNIASLPGIIQAWQNDMSGCSSAIERTLTNYFSRYFQDVGVTSTYELADKTVSDVLTNFTVTIHFTHNGSRQDVARLLQSDGNIFTDISRINNG